MKKLIVLLGIAQCLAVIAPIYAEPNNEHEHHKSIRHRPKRQFPSDYGYHSQWPRPYYEPRRDDALYDLQTKVNRLLEEISDLRRLPPPPPPQLIYIPYPIQYPVQQPVRFCKCQGSNQTPNITLHNRFPEMDDINQNWGYDLSQEVPENYLENARPINFDRAPPPAYTTRPPPRVDHGTTQAAGTGKSPREGGSVRSPQKCDAVVLSCCDPQQTRQEQHRCFTVADCADYFQQADVCSAAKTQEILDLFAAKYSPVH